MRVRLLHMKRRISAARIERVSKIWPERNPEEVIRESCRRSGRISRAILIAGLIIPVPALIGGAGIDAAAALAVLISAAAAIPVMRQESSEKEREKKIRAEIDESYAEVARELAVYIAAGFTVRSTWNRMAEEYRENKASGGRRIAVNEEILHADRMMREGFSEAEALTAFGDRTGLIRYMRLANLLISGARNGRSDLCAALRLEAAEAESKKLDEARKRGEKMASGLLLPTVAMFMLIMIMLIAPAIMTW